MNNKYLLSDLVTRLQKKGYDAKQAELLTRSFFLCLEKGLDQDQVVKINQFGQFKLQEVDARESVDVNTGKRVEIKAHCKLNFLPDAHLKELVNAPLSHLQAVVLDEDSKPEKTLAEKIIRPSVDKIQAKPQEKLVEVPQASAEEERPAEINNNPLNVNQMKKQEEKALFEVQETPESPKKGSKKSNGWLLVLCLVAIVLIIYAMLSKESKKEVLKETIVSEQVTVLEPEMPVAQEPEVKAEQSMPELNPAAWPTKKEVVLGKGERLTLLALENYGDKVFWVYIYEANKDKIANPNDVKAGTRIRIPQLPIALINAKSTESMARAKALEEKYKAQFAK